jgi:hypothetical protein
MTTPKEDVPKGNVQTMVYRKHHEEILRSAAKWNIARLSAEIRWLPTDLKTSNFFSELSLWIYLKSIL